MQVILAIDRFQLTNLFLFTPVIVMVIVKDLDIRNYFLQKSKYISKSEYQTVVLILEKLRLNESNECFRIKEQGDLEYRKGNFLEAIRLYSKFIKDNPTPILYNNRAACFHKLQNYEKSIEDCKRGLLLDPSYIKFYLRLAVIKKDIGEFNDSLNWVNKGLEIDSSNSFLKDLLKQLMIKESSESLIVK